MFKAIHTTLNIQEDKVQLSLYDKMYQEGHAPHVLVHKVLLEAVRRKWSGPERAPFFSKSPKRRFPFDEDKP